MFYAHTPRTPPKINVITRTSVVTSHQYSNSKQKKIQLHTLGMCIDTIVRKSFK